MKVIDPQVEAEKKGNDHVTSPIVEPTSYNSVLTVKDLPTKYKPYPQGAVIRYTPFKYGEVQAISSSKLSELEQIEYYLNGIQTDKFEKDHLSYHDFLYVGLLRKISTFSNDRMTINFTCPCGKDNVIHTSLMEVEFEDISPILKALPIRVKLHDGTELSFRPFTVKDKIDSLRNGHDLEDQVTYLAYCCSSHERDVAYKCIAEAEGDKAIAALDRVSQLLEFGSVTTDCKCRECERVSKIPLSEVLELITPFRESQFTDDDLLVFG